MAISALLAFAVPAGAETVDTTIVPDLAAEAPASPEPAPTSIPEPVESPEVAGVTNSTSEAVSSGPDPSTPDPVQASSSTPAPADAVPTSAVSDAVSATPSEVDPPVRVEAEPDATVAAVTAPVHRVSKLAGEVVESSSKPVTSVVEDVPNAVTSVVDGAARSGGEALRQAPAQLLSEVAAPVRQAVDDLLASAGIEDGLLPVADRLPPGPGQAPSGSVLEVPSPATPTFIGPLSIGGLLEGRVGGPGGLPAKYLTGFDGAETSNLGAPGSLGEAKGAALATLVPGDPSRAVQHSNGPAPLDDPGPLPGTPGAAASGSGATIFVPFAALLALLALVAPATLRRLREVPGFPAPTPFVCALERPG